MVLFFTYRSSDKKRRRENSGEKEKHDKQLVRDLWNVFKINQFPPIFFSNFM
jgi:hypothetical protein